jgi:cell division protein FtsL
LKTTLIIAILSLFLSSIFAQTETASVNNSNLDKLSKTVKVKKNSLDISNDFSIEESVRKQKLAIALKHEIIKSIEYPELSSNDNTGGTVVVEFHL